MTTQREPSGQRDDVPLQVIGHRLQKVEVPNRANGSSSIGSPHARSAPHAAPGSVPRKTAPLRQVVLVDREIDALRDIAIALRDEYDFHITISGTEALNLLRAGGIDTIVVGQTLYSSTGLNVLAEARHHAPDTHRVLLANAVEAGAIERGAAAVAPFKVLQRPCTSENLRELLETNHTFTPHESAPVAPRVQPVKPADNNESSEIEHVVLETMPELPRRKSAPRRDSPDLAAALPVVVYTDDADFYQSIVRALQDRHEVRLCTQLERAAEMAEQGQCPLIITDRAATQVELQRISIALRALDGGVQTIASGTPDVGAALRKFLGTGALHSFLPKPINAPLVRLSVEGAKRQYLHFKSLQDSQPELKATSNKSPFVARAKPSPVYVPGFNRDFAIEDEPVWRRVALPVVAVLLVAVVGAGGWYWWRSEVPAVATEHANITRELDLGRKALADDRITQPANDNALYYFGIASQRAPQDSAANAGLQQAVDRAIEETEQALLHEQLDDAAVAIAAVRSAQPANKRLAFLQSQLDKERARRMAARETRPQAALAAGLSGDANSQRSASTESESAGTPINRWITTARQRLNQNRLTAPEADSAEYYFRQADRTDPGNAAARQGLREIGGRLLDDAKTAVSRQQFDQARRSLAEAARFDISPAVLERAQRDVELAASSVARSNYLRLALQRTRENKLYEPERDSAKYYLIELQRIDPGAAETQQAAQAFALRLIDNANVAVDQKQLSNAAQLLNETRRLGFAGPELAAAERRLLDARSPVVASSAAIARAATPPKPVKTVPPKFPEDAMKAGVQGWVDVGFRILPTGDVVDVVALASSPSGRYSSQFERAAVAALRQYKYEPQQSSAEPRSMVQKVMFKIAN